MALPGSADFTNLFDIKMIQKCLHRSGLTLKGGLLEKYFYLGHQGISLFYCLESTQIRQIKIRNFFATTRNLSKEDRGIPNPIQFLLCFCPKRAVIVSGGPSKRFKLPYHLFEPTKGFTT